jgi:hypothetical protein
VDSKAKYSDCGYVCLPQVINIGRREAWHERPCCKVGVCIVSKHPVRMGEMMPYVTVSGDPVQASVLLGELRVRKYRHFCPGLIHDPSSSRF